MEINVEVSFNPYFTGSISKTDIDTETKKTSFGFNPYFTGSISKTMC